MNTQRDQFHSALFIVGCASGNGGLLDALLPYAHAGLLDQVKTDTAAVICEKYGLKASSLSVLQKLPKATWTENGKQRPNPASTIYTYIQALKACGNDFAKMAALTPSGIVKATKPEAPKKERATGGKPEAPAAQPLTIDDAIQAILQAHAAAGLTFEQYTQLASIAAPVTPLHVVARVDGLALAH